VSPNIPADERAILRRDNHERALRHAIWLALLHAQELVRTDIEGELTRLLVNVDQRREVQENEGV
jgi:hypothetical protein